MLLIAPVTSLLSLMNLNPVFLTAKCALALSRRPVKTDSWTPSLGLLSKFVVRPEICIFSKFPGDDAGP